jgi:uncharacterized SAM-binding protein YcdF (DUF218 family)
VFRLTRKLALLVVVLLVAGAAACVVNAGNMLVEPGATELPQPADAIVVLSGTPADRWLEGYDLWRAGRAPLIVLSRGTVKDRAVVELERRGVRWANDYDTAIRILTGPLAMPAASVQLLSKYVDNTADEAAVLRDDARAKGWKRVIVVTSIAHTRRTALALRRVLGPAGIDFSVRGSRYDSFRPARWWRSRESARWVLVEWPKLLLYRMGLRE